MTSPNKGHDYSVVLHDDQGPADDSAEPFHVARTHSDDDEEALQIGDSGDSTKGIEMVAAGQSVSARCSAPLSFPAPLQLLLRCR